jgi:hypothetical protein
MRKAPHASTDQECEVRLQDGPEGKPRAGQPDWSSDRISTLLPRLPQPCLPRRAGASPPPPRCSRTSWKQVSGRPGERRPSNYSKARISWPHSAGWLSGATGPVDCLSGKGGVLARWRRRPCSRDAHAWRIVTRSLQFVATRRSSALQGWARREPQLRGHRFGSELRVRDEAACVSDRERRSPAAAHVEQTRLWLIFT